MKPTEVLTSVGLQLTFNLTMVGERNIPRAQIYEKTWGWGEGFTAIDIASYNAMVLCT